MEKSIAISPYLSSQNIFKNSIEAEGFGAISGGQNGDHTLIGDAGDDKPYGELGSNYLDGEDGNNRLNGLFGRCKFEAANDTEEWMAA